MSDRLASNDSQHLRTVYLRCCENELATTRGRLESDLDVDYNAGRQTKSKRGSRVILNYSLDVTCLRKRGTTCYSSKDNIIRSSLDYLLRGVGGMFCYTGHKREAL